ncbi:hypothetical protein [Novosphingobium sp. CF614]|uniref:hypothetical protein n=1 Tax=Novosphingobium sp. CF614 TaxID=1884364 RepID=UPI003515A2A9
MGEHQVDHLAIMRIAVTLRPLIHDRGEGRAKSMRHVMPVIAGPVQQILVTRNAQPLPRTNLILISGGDVPSREATHSLILWDAVPEDYTAAHDLQVVELILKDGDKLIDGVYDALWPI